MTRALALLAIATVFWGAACTEEMKPSDGGADLSTIVDQAQANADRTIADQSPAPDQTAAPDQMSMPDLAAKACAQDFAGCTAFTDLTADGATRVVTFMNYEYSPKCIQVRAGQTITFQGDFVPHPLTYACGPVAKAIPYVPSGTTASFTLTTPGLYGYYCLDHGNELGQSMSGAISVVP